MNRFPIGRLHMYSRIGLVPFQLDPARGSAQRACDRLWGGLVENLMQIVGTALVGFLAALSIVAVSAAAQISAPEPDPLARMRQAAAANTQACSESEMSACAQAAPKIIANALGASPLAENLRRLTDGIGGRLTGSPAMAKAVEWAVAAFRDAGVDDVHTEKFTIPHTWGEGATRIEVLSPPAFPLRAVS